MTEQHRRVAAFDVDGTLTTRDCVVPFIRQVGGTRTVAIKLLAHGTKTIPAALRRDRDALKVLASNAAFAGKPVTDVGREAASFARYVHSAWMRSETVAALEEHRRAGDEIVLVSASFEVYLRPLGGLLGVDAVLATRLHVDDHSRFSGAIVGNNCRGLEKVRRLHGWLDERHGDIGGRAGVHVTAYGDSTGDRELLLDADEAVFIGPKRPAWLP